MFYSGLLVFLFFGEWVCGAQGVVEDLHEKCQEWASSGECEINPSYMLVNCAPSCEADKRERENGPLEDKHEKCPAWSASGECSANPNYMLRNCRKSCQAIASPTTPSPTDFYSLRERDIMGNLVYFHQFRGKLVYIVNVASQCGYTAENYKILQHLSRLRSDRFEIMIFPCNQFGGQEPDDAGAIAYFAAQFGYEGLVMAKGDVNGAYTSDTFSLLKAKTGKKHVSWNFDGKFLVGPGGEVELLSGDVVQTIEKRLAEMTSEL